VKATTPEDEVEVLLPETEPDPVLDAVADELPEDLAEEAELADDAALEVADDVGAELAAEEEAAEVDVAEAEAEAGEELEPEPEPGLAATQEQTARADDETARPVTAPQALTTQPRAALWMAADCEEEHWQAKSVAAQPAPEAAEARQEEPQAGT
jgi:uncharacterized protein YqfA (UPF0365 family)